MTTPESQGLGTKCWHFTISLSPQCWAFSGAVLGKKKVPTNPKYHWGRGQGVLQMTDSYENLNGMLYFFLPLLKRKQDFVISGLMSFSICTRPVVCEQ